LAKNFDITEFWKFFGIKKIISKILFPNFYIDVQVNIFESFWISVLKTFPK